MQRSPSWTVSRVITEFRWLQKIMKNIIYNSLRYQLLQGHAVWPEKIEATYQIAMTVMFHIMMHKEMEIYINDMIAQIHG